MRVIRDSTTPQNVLPHYYLLTDFHNYFTGRLNRDAYAKEDVLQIDVKLCDVLPHGIVRGRRSTRGETERERLGLEDIIAVL